MGKRVRLLCPAAPPRSRPLSGLVTPPTKSLFCSDECKAWAANEAKWLLRYMVEATTLMNALMELPGELSRR